MSPSSSGEMASRAFLKRIATLQMKLNETTISE
jgi:hypothetical protein